MTDVSVVLGDYPHTELLKSQTQVAGLGVTFPHIDPVHDAFDDMVRSQPYDVCEMALGAFFQACDAKKPVKMLPLVMKGAFQHTNLYASPEKPEITAPTDLKGRTIGVKSYSQTTGLWVRGWLAEEFDVHPQDVTWYVTEGSHSDEFVDPDNVVEATMPIKKALLSGEIDAAVLGKASAPGLNPLVSDHAERDRAWYERYGCVPINHMVVVTDAMIEREPEFVRAMYRLVVQGIEEHRPTDGRPTAIQYGMARVRTAMELAAQYAVDQGLISTKPNDVAELFAFGGEIA